MAATLPAYTKKDFQSDQEVRWCPGCGDYAILSAVQSVFPELGVPREKFVVVSGIGCSSRFPYYMNTFGFHTIHGRAPAVATGIKIARPDLEVWVATGDGDSLSIGGNHTIHMLRRNVGIKVLLFNNRIYGLTKGQYSPTSELGKKAKSTPYGSLDRPFNPLSLALGRGGHLRGPLGGRLPAPPQGGAQEGGRPPGLGVRRGPAELQHLQRRGLGGPHRRRTLRDDTTIALEHGQPLVFGKGRDKGIRMNGLALEVVKLGDGITEKDLDRPRRAQPEPRLRVPPLADGRDAGLPDAHRRAARGRRAALRGADRRAGPRGHREEGEGRPRAAAARRRHVGGPVTPRNTSLDFSP